MHRGRSLEETEIELQGTADALESLHAEVERFAECIVQLATTTTLSSTWLEWSIDHVINILTKSELLGASPTCAQAVQTLTGLKALLSIPNRLSLLEDAVFTKGGAEYDPEKGHTC